ncbi:MAG: aldo/keto reductase [Myxococcaceae bacterium]|nr:aldo/keto reductase [Myxococcaceae bacterium]
MSPPPLTAWLSPRSAATPALVTVGTMNFGTRTPAAEAERIVARALERGCVFFDTANLYGQGESERILGRAVKGRRTEVGIATKVGLARVRGRPEGLAPDTVRRSVDESLSRLGTDHLELLYLHAPDAETPAERTLDALAELMAAGKILHWGVSNFAAWQVLELRMLAQARGLPPPAVSQVLYNLLVRQVEVEYLPFTRRYPVHTTVYNPLAGGLLSGRYTSGAEVPQGSRFDKNPLYQRRYWSPRMHALAVRYAEVAADAGMSLLQFSYAWLAAREGVDSVLVGPGTLAHLEAALDALAMPCPPDLLARVDAVHREYLGTDASYAR